MTFPLYQSIMYKVTCKKALNKISQSRLHVHQWWCIFMNKHGHHGYWIYMYMLICLKPLTHWGRVMHICISKLTIIGSDNGLAPGRRHTIIWTNDGILLIGPLWRNFSEILIGIQTFSFKKMLLKMSSAKWRPFCRGLNVLTHWPLGDWNKILDK